MLNEGSEFAGRYKFIKLLGRGGFAEVWLAEDNMTGVQVAVKVYAPGTGLDENGIKIFTQEFAGVFDMNHTNLLRPTHYDCYDRMPYLIMPYVKNGSAFKYIVDEQKIPEDECWKMLHDVAAGLAYLHEKNPPLIHQDIKPDNILIDDEGHYLITDFGISARVRSTIRGALAQEQSGGTLAYMGPERFSTTPKPIMASDVWSLGAMMFELMTGMPPFGNHGGMLQKNGADIPIIEGDYSQQLKDIIYAALAKEPWDRPSARKIEELAYNKLHGIVTPTENAAQNVETEPVAPVAPTPPLIESPLAEATGQHQELIPKQQQQDFTSNQQDFTPRQQDFTPKKSQPITPKKGISKGIIAAAVAGVLVIGGGIAMCGGNENDSQPAATEPVAATVPAVNYDSLAQVKISEGIALMEQADTFAANHVYDKFDVKYNKVEETYLAALQKLESALDDEDSLSAMVASQATARRDTVKARLLAIYKELKDGAEVVSQYGTRAEAILPSISELIETNSNNDNSDE